ncbi:flagellar brake protein [Alcaligenaceae bacterium CGII-47]|nr:flagellar brake protein [Alcaligenaceae bacterium CGII-47]
MPTDDSHHLVTLPLEIKSIINSIYKQKTLVHLDIPGQDVSLLSTILEIDAKTGNVVMDVSSETDINAYLLNAKSVRFQASLQRILIEFHGPLTSTTQDGKPALAMPQPTALQRLQRREYFRVDVPLSNPATCTLRAANLPDGELTLTVRDISAGGVQLIDMQQQLTEVAGAIYNGCTLDMPGIGKIDLQLRGVRSLTLAQENDKVLHTAAFRYFNLPGNKQITIQQYIGSLERLIMARRWGGGN